MRRAFLGFASIAVLILGGMMGPGARAQTSTATALVSVGSPSDIVPRSHQNEPAVAIDANNPSILVAGSNDYIDQQECPQPLVAQIGSCTTNPTRPNTGVSGVYFSFDSGHSWTQPTYTGWTRRDCSPTTVCSGHVGPIGTIPWYFENGLVSFGDPAVSIGPKPGPNGFAWSNGSRVYYANLAAGFDAPLQPVKHGLFKGELGVAVSRLDNPTPARVQLKSSWMPPVVAIRRGGTFSSEDKEQVWADNAASSPYFGSVYLCSAAFRSNGFGVPVPMMFAYSRDGGSTWTTRQIPGATGGGNSYLLHSSGDACTIRTSSDGRVYLFATETVNGQEAHVMRTSADGGKHWSAPSVIVVVSDPCFNVDPVYGRCVMDGYAGARIDLAAAASVDIANGAPSGNGATNAIVDTWSDGSAGLNHERATTIWSLDGGATWSGPSVASLPGDRSMYAANAISPDGSTLYVVYEGPIAPWQGADMFSPRPYHGVFRSAPMTANGPGPWSTLLVGPTGDLRGTFPGHDIYQERVGDYVYAAAARAFGVGVWTDARDATVCPAVQRYRDASLAAGSLALPAPWPPGDCAAGFGNTDIWSATG
jgi:hypothetical protein